MAQRFIRISVVYLLLGAVLGMYMGMSQDFRLMPVHAHVLLAGWLTLAMSGVIYRLWPAAAGTGLARAHFWLHNLGLPVFMLGLGLMLHGHAQLKPVIAIGASVLLLGLACLTANVWLRVPDVQAAV